ncbi:MAG: adenine-specific methyltransferase EcoRI family protein [Bacteroidales bacterium]
MTNAQSAKNDEFYTQFHDIEKEVSAYLEYNPDVFKNKTILLPCDDPEWSNFTKYFAQNFERFGLKKLISTSYAPDSKLYKTNYQPTLFRKVTTRLDKVKTTLNGKIFTLTRDVSGDGKINIDDLEWEYLKGDGDFHSVEIKSLRDEADIIITNPPFSLFRNFLAWIIEVNKSFLIIGNMNAIAYKELFPLIQEDKLWLGVSNFNKGMYFQVPDDFVYADSYKFEREQNGVKVNRVPGICWFTNLDHGRRHQPIPLMTMADNIKFSRHKEIKGKEYEKYDNYNAIEVPFADSIPSDYDGIMGVPITFLDKYSPEQFEIIWQASGNTRASAPKEILQKLGYTPHHKDKGGGALVNGKMKFGRILIKRRNT